MESKKEKLLKLVHEGQDAYRLLTFREAAKKLRLKQSDIQTMAEDLELNINIGLSTYMGIYVFEKIGDYSLEDLNWEGEN